MKQKTQIVSPNKYLIAVDRDELRIIRDAIGKWEGPHPGMEARTPAEQEYNDGMRTKAADLFSVLCEALGGEGP